jgi:hypothetical protein
MMPIVISTPNI